MASFDDEMTPEEFDAAFDAGEPVEVTGSLRVRVEGPHVIPGGYIVRRADHSFGSIVVKAPALARNYAPKVPGEGATTSVAPVG